MKKKRDHSLTAAFILIFLIILAFSDKVYARKQESLNSSVKSFMTCAGSLRLKKLRSYVDSFGHYGVFYYTDPDEKDVLYRYYKKCARKMSYKVVSVKREKSTAVVRLKVRYVNSYRFTKYIVDRISDDLINDKISSDDLLDEKKMTKYLERLVVSSEKKAGKFKYRTSTVRLTFIKKGGRWKVKKMTKAVNNILQANIPSSLEKLVKDASLLSIR